MKMKQSMENEYHSKQDDVKRSNNYKIEDAIKNSTNLLVSQIIGIVPIPSKEEILKQNTRLSNKHRTITFQNDFQQNSKIFEENEENSSQQELHHDGNKNNLTTSISKTIETVEEFSRRKNSLNQDAAASILIPPKVLLENTKDEKLLMRFVSIIVYC
jgi:hypothetical protein